MRQNAAKTALTSGGRVVSGWLTVGHPLMAEVLAHAGYDAVTVDLQHGAVAEHDLVSLLQAISTTDVTPFVRVARNEPARVMKALDLGAYGIIAPMIDSADDVRALVSAGRYPPQGRRSYGPTRAALYGGADYASHADDEVVLAAMIETRAALDDLDAILAVEGLDLVFVGPADLSQALGGSPGADFDDGPVPRALDVILAASERHGVPAGIFCKDPDYARRMLDAGFRFVTVGNDVGLLGQASAAALARLRSG